MKVTKRDIILAESELDGLHRSRLVDIRMDGHRVWSVRLPDPVDGRTVVQWPRPLRERLHGRSMIVVEDSVLGGTIARLEKRFGWRSERIAITDKRGQWMAMTKWDRLGPVLEGSRDAVADRLLVSARALIDDLESWGYPVYIVGGTLLGIIRNGEMLPHDDDIDLAFLSDEWHPLELGRVSYEMERKLTAAGYTVVRHSLAQLEVVVFDQAGEIDHYIDIFTGFFRDGEYCQPFALRGPEVTREDLVPTRPLEVNGVALPAPNNPEAWLRYAYGEGWRVPDPTFKFIVPSGTRFRFASWFGVFNRGRYFWEKHFQGRVDRTVPPRGREDVQDFLDRIPPGSNVIDLGCGDGALTQLIADAGHRVVGIDYSYEALRIAGSGTGPSPTYLRVNMNDRAAMLELASQVIRTREVWHVFLRDTIHGLTWVNKQNVYLFLAAALRGDATAYITFPHKRTSGYVRSDPRTWSYRTEDFELSLSENGLVAEEMHAARRVGGRPRTVAVVRAARDRARTMPSLNDERDEDIQ